MIRENFLSWDLVRELKDFTQLKKDLLSGLTVALALVPEAIAFSFVAGVNPIVGLHAAFLVGIITAIFWGRPGMISGATGAMAVVMTWLVVLHGIEMLFAALILTGVLQIAFWIFGLGKLVRLIPHSVMLWFVNGLAIIIFMSQIEQFKVHEAWITGMPLLIMLALIALTMLIIYALPKFSELLPPGLVAIIVVTLLSLFLPFLWDVRTVASYLAENGYAQLVWSFPTFHIPQISVGFWEMLQIIAPYSLILAIIWLTESLMTLSLIDELTQTRWKNDRESIGQGIANGVCGLFWAMWGCAMIGQSMINISNGGRWRWSGISAAVFLILLVVFATSFISMIPIAALVWLMFMVVIGTFAWPTLRMLPKIPRSDACIIVIVTAITVIFENLALAVVVGVLLSALVFAWEKAKLISVEKQHNNKITTYKLSWLLYFASITRFKELFSVEDDHDEVVIDFAHSRVMDLSAIEAINSLTEKYKKAGKKLHLIHLSADCAKKIDNANEFVEVNIAQDPKYFVAHIAGK